MIFDASNLISMPTDYDWIERLPASDNAIEFRIGFVADKMHGTTIVSKPKNKQQTVRLAGASPGREKTSREMSDNGQNEPALELLEVLTRHALTKEKGIRALAHVLRLWALRNNEGPM